MFRNDCFSRLKINTRNHFHNRANIGKVQKPKLPISNYVPVQNPYYVFALLNFAFDRFYIFVLQEKKKCYPPNDSRSALECHSSECEPVNLEQNPSDLSGSFYCEAR